MTMDETKSKQNRVLKLFSHTLEIEKDLKAQLKVKSAFEKSISFLRDNFKEICVEIIFLDPIFSSEKDVEHNLWKIVFYKVIEEYRRRIRKYANSLQKKDRKSRDELNRICDSFHNFLQLSIKFYEDLITKFQETFHLKLDGSVDYREEKKETYHAYLSCHRCYIFLGDLARYHRDLQGHHAQKDWQKAAAYYRRALLIVPDSGNPHNQLAVLATYMDNDFDAVYYYFHSINVLYPFMTGRDNLAVLFEKNKMKLENNAQMAKSLEIQPLQERKKYFLYQFIRFHGILFQKHHLHLLEQLQGLLAREFKNLLSGEYFSNELILKIFVINIFSIYNASKNEESDMTLENNPALPFLNFALGLSFQFLKEILEYLVHDNFQDVNKRDTLAPVSVFFDFLRCNPSHLDLKKGDKHLWKLYFQLLNQSNISHSQQEKTFPLPEEIELRGLLPFEKLYRSVPVSDSTSNNEHNFYKARISKIHNFAQLLSLDSDDFGTCSSQETKFYDATSPDARMESSIHSDHTPFKTSKEEEMHMSQTSNDLSPDIDEEIPPSKQGEGMKTPNQPALTPSAIGSGREHKGSIDQLSSFDLFGNSPVASKTFLFDAIKSPQQSPQLFSSFIYPNNKEEKTPQKEFSFATQQEIVPASSYWSATPNPHSFFSEPGSPTYLAQGNSVPQQNVFGGFVSVQTFENSNALPFPFPGASQPRYQTKNPFIS